VEASITGLDPRTAMAVIEAMQAEAFRLLEKRAKLRRFRRPLTVRSFDSSGNVILKWGQLGSEGNRDNPERGDPGAIVIEDARGRKASVRIELSN
jgi:hypothetical protein